MRTTGGALKGWLIARTYNALIIGALWLVGLLIVGIPWAPFWAILGGLFQFIPNIGPVLALVGPMIAAGVGGIVNGHWDRLLYLLILYAVIAAIDGFVVDPYLMKRTARVPVWASIIVPIVMGFFLGFWGVLLSAPLLAIVFAYRARFRPGVDPRLPRR